MALDPDLNDDQIARLKANLDNAMMPPGEEWVRGFDASLMGNYYVADHGDLIGPESVNMRIAALMKDPCPPGWVMVMAAAEWLAGPNSRRKPQPGDLREICFEIMTPLMRARSRIFLHKNPSARKWHPLAAKWPEVEIPKDQLVAPEKMQALLESLTMGKVIETADDYSVPALAYEVGDPDGDAAI